MESKGVPKKKTLQKVVNSFSPNRALLALTPTAQQNVPLNGIESKPYIATARRCYPAILQPSRGGGINTNRCNVTNTDAFHRISSY